LTAANAAGTPRGEAFVEVKPKAAEPDVATRARQLYRDGESKMRAKQFADGVALLRKAGELGDTRAMLRLGDIYGEDGEGHVLDEPEAARWFRKAADAGDAEGMLHLGGCYELGAGVPASDELAVTWYRKASDSGDASATYNLAKMYESGRGIPRDTVQARILYQRAADMGEAEAKAWIAQHGGH
jgi:TPR repeat protein